MAELTEEEAQDMVRQFQEARETTTSFFTKVVKNPTTTRIGNLTQEELGMSHHPVRTYKELELFCRNVCSNNTFADYFGDLAEIQTATSLSKEGFLIKQVGTSRRELADVTKKKQKPKGFFKKKEKEGEENE